MTRLEAASRPIRWIVRESREANRTDFARIPSDGLRDAPRASTDGLARFLSDKLRSRSRASIGRTHIRNPPPAFPRTDFARIRKADANSTISQPRYGRNQPPLNHDSTILRVESKNDSDSTIPHPIFSNHNSTTRKRIREAAAESSYSWSLGEYAVSIRSDFRSTASLPPHIRVLCKRSAI